MFSRDFIDYLENRPHGAEATRLRVRAGRRSKVKRADERVKRKAVREREERDRKQRVAARVVEMKRQNRSS